MKDLKSAMLFLLVSTLLLGGGYPLLTGAMASLLFPRQASGSILTDRENRCIGSALIGQPFAGHRYFHSRPSATGGHPYNALASGGSNLGPTNPAFLQQVANRIEAYRAAYLGVAVPADLMLASASGLDPHITPAAALAQVTEVAATRRMDKDALRRLVAFHVEDRQWGFLGEPRVNVLALNLDLDKLYP